MTEEVKQAEVAEVKATKVKGKKGKRVVTSGQVHIKATFNNTIISVSDKKVRSSLSHPQEQMASVALRKVLPMQHKSLPKKLVKSQRKIMDLAPLTSMSKALVLVAIAQFAPSPALVLKSIA